MKLRRGMKKDGNLGPANKRLAARIKDWEVTQSSLKLNKDSFRKPGSMKK